MSEKTKKVPKLRFPEFTDEWEQCKLGEVVEIYDNLRVPISSVNRIKGDTPYYGANGIQDYVEGFTHNGEYILIAEDGVSNLRDYPIRYVNVKFWANNHVHVIKSKKYSNIFLSYVLKNTNIEPYIVGSGRTKLNLEALNKIVIKITSNIQEQEKIGNFFKSVDEIITIHQRKLENLKKLKKSLLQKMFPKNGNKLPEIRFPEFTDTWEQCKLGEVVEWTKGNGLSKSKLNKDKIGNNVVHYADLYTFSAIVNENISWSVSDEGVLIPNNSLLFPMSDVTSNGLARTTTVMKSGVKAGSDILIGILKENLCSKFLSLEINHYSRKMLPLITGTTVRHISSVNLSTLEISISTLPEQTKIGNFFKSVDDLITIHQQKLENLKKLKKGLLQQMFV